MVELRYFFDYFVHFLNFKLVFCERSNTGWFALFFQIVFFFFFLKVFVFSEEHFFFKSVFKVLIFLSFFLLQPFLTCFFFGCETTGFDFQPFFLF